MVQTQSAADARAAAQTRVRFELLAELVRKDLKVKYKNSALGFIWSLANPLLYLAVFTLVFEVFLDNGISWFAVLFMSGLLVWNFFNLSTLSATGAVVGNANLVRKIRFPRIVLPLSSVGFAGVHFTLQMLVFLLFLVPAYPEAFGPQLWLAVPALAVALTFTVAMSLLASALNVRYRDVPYAIPFLTQIWLYATPVIWTIDARSSYVPAGTSCPAALSIRSRCVLIPCSSLTRHAGESVSRRVTRTDYDGTVRVVIDRTTDSPRGARLPGKMPTRIASTSLHPAIKRW